MSMSALVVLWRQYHDNGFPGQRFGQAVVNHFNIGPNPDLFYCEDDERAFMLAIELLAEIDT